MPGHRGRKNPPHPHYPPRQNYFNYPMWPNHQQDYCDPFLQRGWVNNGWNAPQEFSGRPGNNFYTRPQTQHHHRGQRQADTYQFDQFPQRSGHGDTSSPHGPSSSANQQRKSAMNDRNIVQSGKNDEAVLCTPNRSRTPINLEKSNTRITTSSINIPEKLPAAVPTQPATSMPAKDDDLRNKVKASLKMMAATKDQVPVRKIVSLLTEPSVPRQQELRVSTSEDSSPSVGNGFPTRQGIRVTVSGSHRRAYQSSNPVINDNLLEGIGFIQTTGTEHYSADKTDETGIAGANLEGDGKAQESESATAISKDYSNRYIRSLDNHQRRQLVDQPRDINSQFMLSRSLNSLEKEYQTARARQLSSLSRVNPIEREMTSKIDSPIVLSEELGGQFTEMSVAYNEVPVSTTLFGKPNETEPEEEIQVIEWVPKTPPLCIDLDEDSSSSVSSTSSTDNNKTQKQQQAEKQPNSIEICFGARPDILNNALIVSAAREVPLQTPVNTIRNSSPAVGVLPCNLNIPAPMVLAANAPLNSSLGICTTGENLLETAEARLKVTRLKEKWKKQGNKDRMAMNTAIKKAAQQLKRLINAKKQKQIRERKEKKSPTKSPLLLPNQNTANQVPVQSQPTVPVQALAPAASEANVNKETASVSVTETEDVPKLTLEKLQIEERESKDRIAEIDGDIEKLQREREVLTDRVFALKQKQLDLQISSHSDTPFEIRNTDKDYTFVTTQTAKDELVGAEPSKVASGKVVPPSHTMASAQLPSLVHQPEEIGIQVVLDELDLSTQTVFSKSSLATKRKRATGDETSKLKKKTIPTNSPAPNATSVQDVAVVPTNPPVSESIPPPDVPEFTKSPPSGSSALVESSLLIQKDSSEGGPSKPSISPQHSAVVESKILPTTTVPVKASVDTNVAKKQTDAVTSRVVESSLKCTASRNSPLLPAATQMNQKRVQRKSHRATPAVPLEKVPPFPEAGKNPQPKKRTVSNVAAPSGPSTEDNSESTKLIRLQSHATGVRCVFVSGPFIFTASEDGIVHVYDMTTKLLSMRIVGHLLPVTWLYAVALNTPPSEMQKLKAQEYLNQLSLITGCEDTCVRKFSLEGGQLLHEKECHEALTCVAGHKRLGKLYIGSKEGRIFTYNPKTDKLNTVSFRGDGEVICLKIAGIGGKKAIIVAARRMDPVVYDLDTEEELLTLTSNIPSSSFYCISTYTHFIYCCDANKNVFTFDMKNKNNFLYRTDSLPSAAVSCYHDGNRFLILGCIDGVIRILDLTEAPPISLIDLPGQHVKTITCMKVSGNKIVLGTLAGEVSYRSIPNFESLSKDGKQNSI